MNKYRISITTLSLNLEREEYSQEVFADTSIDAHRKAINFIPEGSYLKSTIVVKPLEVKDGGR